MERSLSVERELVGADRDHRHSGAKGRFERRRFGDVPITNFRDPIAPLCPILEHLLEGQARFLTRRAVVATVEVERGLGACRSHRKS